MRRTLFPASLFLSTLAWGSGCTENSTEPPPLPDTTAGAVLAVATSDNQSGALHTVNLATRTVRRNIDVVDAQPVVRSYGSQIFVLDQTHGAMRVYDVSQDLANPSDFPIGNSTVPAGKANPYDIYVDGPRSVAYVTLYGSFGSTVITGANALAVIDLKNPAAGIARFVPLPVAASDPDNNPEATRLVGCGDKLLVLLQDLDRNTYDPVGPGRIAVVDLTQPSSVSIIQLAGKNPTALSPLPGCTEAIVGSAGNQYTGTLASESGIERIDLENKKSFGLVLKGSDLGGNVTTLDAIDARDVFVAVSSKTSAFNNDIYVVDAVSGTRSQKLLGPMNFVPQVRVFAGQLMVLSAGTPGAGQLKTGLYIGPASGAPLPVGAPDAPVDLGLPPISADLFVR